MGKRIWLVLAIGALIATSFAASVVSARRATEDRPKEITRGLDYLHARQRDDGGFRTPENTAWGVMGAVASGERMGNSTWHVKGKSPFDYLQATDLVAASTSADVTNAPVYYARLIMSYVAMDRAGTVGTAGSKGVNLLGVLLTYQDTGDGSSSQGAFSPVPPSTVSAVRTTSWAILALRNLGVSQNDNRFRMAGAWLAAQQNTMPGGDGGFARGEQGGDSTALDTALAYQALAVSSNDADWDPVAARAFLEKTQNADGGFPVRPGGKTDAEATSAGIQAILAMGERPDDPAWTVGVNTPIRALSGLLQENGSYRLTSSTSSRPIMVTGWALVALRGKSFKTYPGNPGTAHTAFRFRPQFNAVSPKNGAKFKTTRSVLIRATYTDFSPKGTGIKTSACRVYVDNTNKTRPATIGRSSLRLQLKNVPNGNHTYTIKLVDHAGNQKIIERKFTVAVPVPTPKPTPTRVPTPRPTYNPGPVYPPVYPTRTPVPAPTPTPTPTPTPYETYTPYPYGSPSPGASPIVTGSPIPSPSASASPSGAEGERDGGSAAGFVGGTLLAMLPIGAVISYLVLHRREDLLAGASQGAVLAGGGSSWERFKQTLAKSKDLTRPSSRE